MAAAASPERTSFNRLDLADSPYRTTIIDNIPQPSKSPRLNSPGPLPLPSFVFPARAPSPEPSSISRSAPASFSRSSGRRPLSAIEIQSQLADGANGDGKQQTTLSHGTSSLGTQHLPANPSSTYERKVSELTGGVVNTGAGAGLLDTNPSNSGGALPSPTSAFGPSGGRRGHAHRRSAAISVGDLTFMLNSNSNNTRGGSAPASPSAMHERHSTVPGSLNAALKPGKSLDDLSNPAPCSKAFKNTRVGFSDEVSIIPRPLSMVSNDSTSTVRPGHSVSNSMSSIVSAGTPPPHKEQCSIPPTYRMLDTRPRTAESFLDREQGGSPESMPKRRGSLSTINDFATSAPSTPRSAKKWSFFGHESASGESSPKSRPTSAESSGKESKKIESAPSSPDMKTSDTPTLSTEPCSSSRRSSISKKPSKKKKEVRSWAGSILSRKSRQRKQKLSRRSPTPPLRAYTPTEQNTVPDLTEKQQPTLQRPHLQTDFTNWKPRKLPPQEESMSPIIDLDAALGPFNTPSSFGDDWDMSQKNGKRKRAMHSAAGLGGFTGPGMHYHRRAESAPEFENPRFGLHRLGSSSTMGMEDVFEEDEDEEWEDTKASDKETSSKSGDIDDEDGTGLGIDVQVVDSEDMESDRAMDFDHAAFQRGVKRKGSGLSETDRRNMSSTKSAHSTTSLTEEAIKEEDVSVESSGDLSLSRPHSRDQCSDSTATPPLRPRSLKDLAPVDIRPLPLQPPYTFSPHSTSQSSFSSPRSLYSYDTQRISTAPSSATDENAFHLLLMGEPGPELRMSVDDVPPPTNSNSMVTPDTSGIRSQLREGQRSASLSSAAVNRKRSSIASLSRLISSSHGEKSKLSIESNAPSVLEVEKKGKSSKGKRISRMMQFWKPKEVKEPSASTS
ncbi:hypothetical protein QTJ16_002996 [Diplocarpon rosae]|uniref:Cell wall proline rich protein n=1 Tax=Diplocarpon rosae TaxID=946125 RepID=A0AAD9WEG3_9HELO|nr:hypothetical protein QTJ16_002996 [Diplocarpon rosae]PBP22872.1 cell wall proline rich protein [Diplocarpon rosae]